MINKYIVRLRPRSTSRSTVTRMKTNCYSALSITITELFVMSLLVHFTP